MACMRRYMAIAVLAAGPALAAGPPDLRPGWNRVPGATGTQCADGSPYEFYVRPGDPERLLVHLMGGGACWSAETCDPEGGTYVRSLAGLPEPSTWGGMFELDNPENPVAGWTVLFVSYCTGDVHLGDRTAEYAPKDKPRFTVHHNGWRNLTSALDWTLARLPRLRRAFVTGTSAGGLASPMAAALLAERRPGVAVVQLADSSGGYRSEEPSAGPAAWNVLGALPAWDGLRGQTAETVSFETLYLVAARRHPEIQFASYDSAEDEVQRFFNKLRDGRAGPLLPRILQAQGTIAAAVPRFASYVAGGMSHGALPWPWFYAYTVGGVRLRDWVAALAEGKPVSSVRCPSCARPELHFTADDIALLDRADQLLAAPERWTRDEPRPCPADAAAALGLGCAVERAARGGHAHAAVEDLRYEVGPIADDVRLGQRLRAWNNAAGRSFAEVKALLARERERARAGR
jgi:hypothetical protein